MSDHSVVLKVDSLTYRHEPGKPQVDNVSFQLHAGQTFGVLGGNECGKTTLARLILGDLPAQAGTVKLFGKSPHQPRRANPPSPMRAVLVLCGLLFAFLLCWKPDTLTALLSRGAWSVPVLLALLELGRLAQSKWPTYQRRQPAWTIQAERHLICSSVV